MKRLSLAVAVVALALAVLKSHAPRVSWQRFDATKVRESIHADENVLVYFRGRKENARYRVCNVENTLRYMPFIKMVQSNQVRCFVGEAWKPNSPAQQEVTRLTGSVPEFQLAAYTKGRLRPILLDSSELFWQQLENEFHATDSLLP